MVLERRQVIVEPGDQTAALDQLNFLIAPPGWEDLMPTAQVEPCGAGAEVLSESILIEKL